jgi:hypothetical protein
MASLSRVATAVIAVVLVVVVVILAILIAARGGAVRGGEVRGGDGGDDGAHRGAFGQSADSHPMGDAIHQHASSLTMADSIFAPGETGGTATGGTAAEPERVQHAFLNAAEIETWPASEYEAITTIKSYDKMAHSDASSDTKNSRSKFDLVSSGRRKTAIQHAQQSELTAEPRPGSESAPAAGESAAPAVGESAAQSRRGPSGAIQQTGATPPARRPWESYATWTALRRDPGAVAAYLAQRAAVINHPDLDWSAVLDQVRPLLAERREYIGVVRWGPGGPASHKLAVVELAASPRVAGPRGDSPTVFASIPGELVARVAETPGLFLFHTHPDDPRCSALPSSHDLSSAIFFGALGRFAASAVISTYGVLVYGLDWAGFRSVNAAVDGDLALLNLSHDVVAAHEATRSWSRHTLVDYFGFYARHRMFIFTFPTPALVADARGYSYEHSLESPADYKLLEDRRRDIRRHTAAAGRHRAGDQAPRHTAPSRIELD